MTIVMRPTCWHQNFGPNGLSAPAQGLCLNVFSSITADFNISSAIRWAIQDQWSSGFVMETTCADSWSDRLNLVIWTCGSWSECQHDLYFTVQWFCLTSWKLFDICTSYFRSMNQYDLTFDLKINVSHCDVYSMVQWFGLISWRLFDVCTSLLWPDVWPQINIGHCDLYFMVQWCCVTSWRLFDVWTSYFEIMDQYDPTFDLKINIGLCDLYFMVQCFCPISPTLFDAWVSYFQIIMTSK